MAKKKEAEHHCCDKMCAMTCCPCHLDIKKLKPLVKNPDSHFGEGSRGARTECRRQPAIA